MMKEYDLSEEHLHLIVEDHFNYVGECMSNPTMPKISLPGFGKFIPSKGQINQSLRLTMRWYRIKGEGYKSRVVGVIKKLWPVRNRLINENNEEYTAKNWRKHFLKSREKDAVVYEEGRKRWWMQDFPGYKLYRRIPSERPNYTLRKDKNNNQ
jgi:hypothetical protein